jgi:hypothetical protein
MRHTLLSQLLIRFRSGLTSLMTNAGWFKRYYSVLLYLILFLVFLASIITEGSDPHKWDLMLISGVAAFVTGVRLSQTVPGKLTVILARLVNRGVLLTDPEGLKQFEVKLKVRAESWGNRGGIICAIAILIAFFLSSGFSKLLLMVFEGLGGYVAGRQLGWMACYGTLSLMFQRESLTLKVQPGHLDAAGGLKPIGDFYFLQAIVAAIPAVYLAIWWVIIPLLPHYARWREPYLGLLAIAITFELLAFAVPLWLFHLEMEEQKIQLMKDADKFSRNISDIQVQLTVAQTSQEREQLKEQLTNLTKRYWDIERMPTWPVDAKTLRRFTLNNLALFIPLIGKFTGNSVVWQSLETLVNGMATK